ncbi:putative cytochrome P450 phenylacetate hydroxylase [Rhizodiscina lignyota]|uniref:Cytochrome P450 phenylacetate hydroxylase n=1 Tax=Rhizodiscina lignyota TaxID=1504668 RepID=A0A9P4IG01_9PEZI|nr:putative cytochrome P450 phenylacetate hydroxylase [Rhizodiscina lignyota]
MADSEASVIQFAAQLLTRAPLLSFTFLSFSIILVYLLVNETIRYRVRNPHFTGPPGLPVIGNIRDIRFHAPSKFQEWSKEYGDVYQIQLGNIPILVVNSAAAAKELIGGNAHAVSSRPVFYTFHKIVAKTAGATIGTSPLSDDLKRRRRAAAAALNKPSVNSYAPHLDIETLTFIKDCLRYGDAGNRSFYPMLLIQRVVLSMVLTVNWGTRMVSSDSELFKEIIEVEGGIVKTRMTTQNFQDYVPLLRLNPFSGDSKQAANWRRRRDVYLNMLDNDLRERMEKGIHTPCIQSNCILDPEAKLSRQDLTTISISLIQGGVETVAGTVSWGIALLANRPDIQAKALQEIRQFYAESSDILCDAHDQEKCTYVAAFVRECLRYFTVLRLALPRSTVQEVNFRGKPIPAGSTIFLNAWACNMDPALWRDADVFRPERWIERPDAPLFTYGLGYRMCAGYPLANRELYLLFMRIISCFEIVKGSEVDVDPVSGTDLPGAPGRKPRKYEVFFRPRDKMRLEEVIEKKETESEVS